MSNFTKAYIDLIIKQYWIKPRARAEIEAQAASWQIVYDLLNSFVDAFDIDLATAHRLDIIGRVVGMPRLIPHALAKIAFGFDENPNARGFGEAPFLDKFAPAYSDLQLDDNAYRLFIKAKIARNIGGPMLVATDRVSLQDVIDAIFNGAAYVVDNFDMSLTLYVSPSIELPYILAIRDLDLLPKPQGVRYDIVIQADPLGAFGFADNVNARGFADAFNPAALGGTLANKVIL